MGVARIYRAPSPFNGRELVDCDIDQSFDTTYFAHLNHKPSKLVRGGHTDWQFSDVQFGPTIAAPGGVGCAMTDPNHDAANGGDAYFPRLQRYVVSAVNDDNGQESLASAEVSVSNDLTLKRNKNVVSWGAVATANRYFVYKANLEGGFGFIGETEGLSFTDDNIEPDLNDGPRQGRDLFAAAGDYPSTLFFVEQRLGWGRTSNNPNLLVMSRSADLENLDVSRPLREDDAIAVRIQGTKVNSINQVVPLDELLVLGSNGLYRMEGANGDYLTASPPPRQRRQNGRGASRLKAIVADEVVFYTPTIGDEVRSINYSFEVNGYKSDNLSIFSPHFFLGYRIVSWAYAEEPLSCVWAVRNDGKLLCFTWQREQEVWGWTICETSGKFLGVAVVPEIAPGTNVAEHRVYFIVERTINGVRRRFVERMSSAKWSDQADACYLDCAASFSFEDPVEEVFVPHLIGATVDLLVDANVELDVVVPASGIIPLASAGRKIHVGLRYVSTIETLPLALTDRTGSRGEGKIQQLGSIVLRVFKTRGVKVGRKLSDLLPMKTRRSQPLGQPKALLSGDYEAPTPAVASNEATLFVQQINPLPMTITAIFLDPVRHES